MTKINLVAKYPAPYMDMHNVKIIMGHKCCT